MTSKLLARVETAPRDPILGVTDAFNADQSPRKVNLGAGVYCDDTGKVPVLECVHRAERQLVEQAAPRTYLPIDGLAAYNTAVRALVFGADCPALREDRLVTIQTLGGTGGLKVGADFLKRLAPDAQVWLSDPSWENHRALFEYAGFTVHTYPYYDGASHAIRFTDMQTCLGGLPPGSIVVLHASCHNPTGLDLAGDQWTAVLETVRARGLVPFLDFAYQGFGEGLDADAAAVRQFARATSPVFISSSFSKSFSLYGERVGALSVIGSSRDEAVRVLSQLKRLVRTSYSSPPTHGARIVATVLDTPDLRALWETELAGMRARIRDMRRQLVEALREHAPRADFSFVERQRGMFSYSGLTTPQVERLREECSVYAIDTGRICVAALNTRNLAHVASAIGRVIA